MLDPVKAERAEAELNKFIDSQAKRKGADAAYLLAMEWAASEARILAKRREENRTAWIIYYSHLAHGCRQRAQEYEDKADELLEDEPRGETAA